MPTLDGNIHRSVFQGEVDEIVRRIKRVPSQETVWHYTTGANLIAIIESRQLWATQISCLNDSQELLLSKKLFEEELASQKENNHNRECKTLFSRLSRFWEAVSNIDSSSFVVSFSELADDLSQWRAYGGVNGENGYCIGFDRVQISRSNSVTKVVYADPPNNANQENVEAARQVRECFRVIIYKLAHAYPTLLRTVGFFHTDENGLLERCVDNVCKYYLGQILPLVKHGAFYAERECRLLHLLRSPEETELMFRQKSQMMTRHLPLGLKGKGPWSTTPASNKEKFLPLPIREVVVGPTRHQAISKHSVEALLRKYGHMAYDRSETGYDWGDVKVSCSLIPLQSK